jgi:hypothetical protein
MDHKQHWSHSSVGAESHSGWAGHIESDPHVDGQRYVTGSASDQPTAFRSRPLSLSSLQFRNSERELPSPSQIRNGTKDGEESWSESFERGEFGVDPARRAEDGGRGADAGVRREAAGGSAGARRRASQAPRGETENLPSFEACFPLCSGAACSRPRRGLALAGSVPEARQFGRFRV